MANPANQPALFENPPGERPPVTCLGQTFADDAARRAYFSDLLRHKLQDPAFRALEGFPVGTDEAILALSDPPYYTACPNPWLGDIVAEWKEEGARDQGPGKSALPLEPGTYHREPFTVDVSVGKTDPLYKAHGYHTKVPHRAIVPSILHYTAPGDVVLDGFCGSGMTGVAAQWCGAPPADFRQELELEWQRDGRPPPQWGARRVVLNDLSPAATFIAANYNRPFDAAAFAAAGARLLAEGEAELGWMYATRLGDGATGRIDYTVWSEVFTCPECAREIVFLEEAFDDETKGVRDTFPCPQCNATLTKRTLERVFESRPDPAGLGVWRRVKFVPVRLRYSAGGTTYEKTPDDADRATLARIEALPWPREMPGNALPIASMYHGSRLAPKGFSHVHHLFLPRAAHALAALWRHADAQPDPRTRHLLLFFVEQAIWGMSVLARYAPTHFSQVNQYLSGVYYVGSQIVAVSPEYILGGKLDRLAKVFQEPYQTPNAAVITTGTAARLALPDACVDYVFTDPPFGENIYYADLNFLVESFHGVLTQAAPEAIVDRAKHKGLADYQRLMTACFAEYYRVLKPGRWLTVVFHNSHNAVWTAIQEALAAAGFVIADVRTLDKQQGSYRQVTSGALKQNLVVSAYKPEAAFETRFQVVGGTAEGAWEFARAHLAHAPVVALDREGRLEAVRERMAHLLYDRMVAYPVLRSVAVPLAAAEFRQGVAARFAQRDEMLFLPEQAVAYDKRRLLAGEPRQLELFVSDESSAIAWLRRQLSRKPQTFQELQPQFMQETKGGWQRYEVRLELRDLLEQNFLLYDGAGEVPAQIHSYLSSSYRDLRNLAKDDAALRAAAKERWYVPDPNKAADVERLRERALLKEFDSYRDDGARRLKLFRLEALRAGFGRAWRERDYATILAVARKLPDDVLREDAKLTMWLSLAQTRLESGL